MNCVFNAYVDHMKYLGYDVSDSFGFYQFIKASTHDGKTDVYTNGAVVRTMIHALLFASPLKNSLIKWEYRLVTPYHLIAQADNEIQAECVRKYSWGPEVDKITLAPAIYMLLADSHAVFSETVPARGIPVMAIQINKE